MIEIIVKMPSLSPTLKWLRVSLAATGGNDRDYVKKTVTKPSLKMAARQLSAYWGLLGAMIEIILKSPSLSPPLKWLRVSLAATGE